MAGDEGRCVDGPHRRCLVSGRVRPKEALVRFVVAPDGAIVADVAGRLPGRGMWLSADRDVIDKAVAGNLFARAARRPVRVPIDLADRVERLLVRRCIDLIGLARRAGEAVAGFEKVDAWLRQDRGGLVLLASDAASGARSKSRAWARGRPLFDLLSGAELGGPFGRGRMVHVAMAPGRIMERVQGEGMRLAGVRGGRADPPNAWMMVDIA